MLTQTRAWGRPHPQPWIHSSVYCGGATVCSLHYNKKYIHNQYEKEGKVTHFPVGNRDIDANLVRVSFMFRITFRTYCSPHIQGLKYTQIQEVAITEADDRQLKDNYINSWNIVCNFGFIRELYQFQFISAFTKFYFLNI